MHDLLGVDPRAVISQISVLRIGDSANIELFEYEAPGPAPNAPAQLRLVGPPHRLLRHRHRRGRRLHGGEGRAEVPRPVPAHRRPRRRAGNQLLQDALRHLHRADQLPQRNGLPGSERQASVVTEAERKRFRRHDRARTARDRPRRNHRADVPGAVGRFEDVLGCSSPLASRSSRSGTTFIHDPPTFTPGPSWSAFRGVARRPPSTSCSSSSLPLRKNFAGFPPRCRTSFYVRHIDGRADGGALPTSSSGPLAPDGPAAGQSINYFRTPFGTYVELISYPQGEAYASTAPIPLGTA